MIRCFFFVWVAVFLLGSGMLQGCSNASAATEEFDSTSGRELASILLNAPSKNLPLLLDVVRWADYKDRDSSATAETILSFVERHPDWPDKDTLLRRARNKLLIGNPDATAIRRWLALKPDLPPGAPLMTASAETLRQQFLRYAWIEGSYTEDEEHRILERHSEHFAQADHHARTDRLIWEKEYSAAGRMLKHCRDDLRKLFSARLALARNQKNVEVALRAVPKKLKANPSLIYERLQWRQRRQLNGGVHELLLQAPERVPYPEKWWPVRALHARDAIEDGNYALAKKLLANHGQTEGGTLADALWLQGWLELEFLDNSRDAYKYFYAMFNAVSYPVSKSRAAYHAGIAADRNRNADIAKSWFEIAESHPATFYGQLAAQRLHDSAPLRLPSSYNPSSAEVSQFKQSELLQLVRLLMATEREELAVRFLNHMVDNAASDHESTLAARSGEFIGSDFLRVKGAKRLMRKNILDMSVAYPVISPPRQSTLEHALMLAIARQESEFNHLALSHAGAAGLMQLMPGTASLVARKLGVAYSKSKLYSPEYNLRLGSAYLQELIERYDGSYILAIAAYNAGPGNVNNWLQRFGHPGKDLKSAIRWTEMIPFAETRNYVQRVLENLQIYRHITTNGKRTPHLRIAEDLTRSQE